MARARTDDQTLTDAHAAEAAALVELRHRRDAIMHEAITYIGQLAEGPVRYALTQFRKKLHREFAEAGAPTLELIEQQRDAAADLRDDARLALEGRRKLVPL